MRWCALLLLVACGGPRAGGTGVGNPDVKLRSHTSLVPAGEEGLTWALASLPVGSVSLLGCDGVQVEQPVGLVVDLLVGEEVALPDGLWCEATLWLDGPLVLEGAYDAPLWSTPGEVSLTLNVNRVDLEMPQGLKLEEQALVLELGWPGWLELSSLGLLTGGELHVEPGGLGHDLYASRIRRGSGWYRDDDDDQTISEEERGDGPAATGDGWGGWDDDD